MENPAAPEETSTGTPREVPGRKSTMKVMVAIDDSQCSRYALSWTLCNLVVDSSDTPLVVFTAQPLLEFINLISDLQENQRRAALALLKEAKDSCAEHGIVPETIVEFGDPKEAVCEAIKKHDIQLLVVGSHGRGAIQRAFLGSVSNY